MAIRTRAPRREYAAITGTFAAARTISRDNVGSFIREPFVEDEEPVETGDLRQTIGELVTCSRCVSARGRTSRSPPR